MATTKKKVASIKSKTSGYYMVPRHKYKLTRLRADLPMKLTPTLAPYYYSLCKPQILHQQSLYISTSFFRPIAHIIIIITPPEELRPANTHLQRQYASITPAHIYNTGVESKVSNSFYRGIREGRCRLYRKKIRQKARPWTKSKVI